MRWPCRGMVRALPSPNQAAALYSKMPPFLERALLPFQREGVRFGLAHGGRCLIAGVLAHGAGHRTEACRLCVCTLPWKPCSIRMLPNFDTVDMCLLLQMRWAWARRCRPLRWPAVSR